jgi:acyl-CoA hydrolase
MRNRTSILGAWVERALGVERRPTSERLDEWAAPDFGDERGVLRAGKILEWMDVIGPRAASHHCDAPVVTAAVERLSLRRPIRVGAHVTLRATVAFTSLRSLGVAVAIDADGARAATGWMTFVALRDGRVQPVPQIRPRSMLERTLFREGRLRRAQHRRDAALTIPNLDTLSAKGSFVHNTEPIRADKLNARGTLHGGMLMRWMETAAGLSAHAHAATSLRFQRLMGLAFLHPIGPQVFVHVRAIATRVAGSEIDVFVGAEAENPLDGRKTEVAYAFMTYTTSRPIPPLACETEGERALGEEAARRAAAERSLAR